MDKEKKNEEQEPVRLDKQHNFQDWLESVGYSSQYERLEELYIDAGSEITSVRDALYTRYHMEKGTTIHPNFDYRDNDEFEKKAFDLYKELYPNRVIYPMQDLHNAELIKQAKIAQTLKFIGSGAIKLTPDQVTTPESPDQSEVVELLLKIKTEKELSDFIMSATIDENKFSKAGVDELLRQLNAPTTSIQDLNEGDNEMEEVKPDGLETTYWEDGDVKSETNYKSNKKDGLDVQYYRHGKPSSVINYKDGQEDGTKTQYYEDGALFEETHYEDGLEVKGIGYYKTGKICWATDFVNVPKNMDNAVTGTKTINTTTSKWTWWYENGQMQKETNYVGDKRNGLMTMWKESGVIISETNYEADIKDGLEITYHGNGRLLAETNYSAGEKDGLEKIYENPRNMLTDITGNLEKEINYRAGKREGLTTEFFENGEIQKQSNYKDDQKDGLTTTWKWDDIQSESKKVSEVYFHRGEIIQSGEPKELPGEKMFNAGKKMIEDNYSSPTRIFTLAVVQGFPIKIIEDECPDFIPDLIKVLSYEDDGGVDIFVKNIMNGYPEENIFAAVPSTVKTLIRGALEAKRKTNSKAEKSDVVVAKPTGNTL